MDALPPTRPPNRITEEQYDMIRYLRRIKKTNPRKLMFIQPLFMEFEFGPFQRIHEILRRTDADIGPAVNLWCSNRVEAEERYGHIGYWDVSSVTNMRDLFRAKENFNDDIRHWDVSNVTNMVNMFWNARTFNQAIGNWDVSKVTDMSFMFSLAENFNQPIRDWDVSKVTNMGWMFNFALAFNQPIGDWDVSKVTNMTSMFSGARRFNQPIGAWDVSNVTSERFMFADCPISNANKPARFRGGGAKNRRRASRKRSQKGKLSRKGRRTLKRAARR